ncbi:MAG: portal protein [Geminicoccaceae bacterium]
MPDTDLDRKLARRQALKDDRRIIDSEYDDLADLLHPTRKGFQSEIARGDERMDDSYDSTPMQARWQLATKIEGFVTPKGGEPWFKIESEDEDLMENHEVRLWYEDATKKTFSGIYDPRAGFQRAGESMYSDIATFGPGPLAVFERRTPDKTLPAFQSIHLKNFHWALNEWGEADTFYVDWERPVGNAAALYGKDNLGDKAKDLLSRGKLDQKIKLLHVVQPRLNRDFTREDNLSMPLESTVIDINGKKIVEESGFPESPYYVPTWGSIAGEPWGWSLGRLLLPDIKMLNQQQRTTLEVGQFVARPPLAVPNEGVIDFSALYPDARLTYDAQSAAANGGRPPIHPINIGANYPISREMTQETRERVWNGFLRSVLNLPVDAPSMTATEVIERKQEMVDLVGPVFGKFETDLSQPIVRRAFWIKFRAGEFLPVPQIMQNTGVKFSVNSPFTAVRKQIEAASVTRVAEILAPLAQSKPKMLDHYDTDEIARDVGESMMPTQWIRSREAVEELRGKRQQAQEAAEQREQTEQMGRVMKDITPAMQALEGEVA